MHRLATTEHPVEPLELFFDLVFAFGFTEVTTLLSEHPTWAGFGHALLIMTALWWAWSSYAWMTNALDPDDGLVIASRSASRSLGSASSRAARGSAAV